MKETLMMDGLENEKRFRRYLESLGVDVSKALKFWGRYTKLKVENPDLFHEIAQATKIREIRDFSGLDFIVDVEGECGLTEHWTVALEPEKTKEFLTKYKGQYTIIKS